MNCRLVALVAFCAVGTAFAGTDLSPYVTEGILTIPASTTVDIDDGNAAAFSAVKSVVFGDETAIIDFKNATQLTVGQPFSGAGKFNVTGGNVILSGDNSAYTGQFTFTDCFVEVMGRYALGSGTAKVSSTNTRGSAGYYQLTFAGDGLTCDAALSISKDHKLMKAETEGQLVLTKQLNLLTANSNYFFPNIYLTQGIKAGGGGSPFGSIVDNCTVYMGPSSPWQYGFSGGNNTKLHFIGKQSLGGNLTIPSRMCVYTEVEDACTANWHFNNISTAADRRVIDLCGNDQNFAKGFTYQNYAPSASKNYYTDVTSDEPATFKVSGVNGTTVDHNFRFRKNANFTCNVGAGKSCNLHYAISDSLGALTAESGTLSFKNGAGWGGTNVVVSGGMLEINSVTSVTNKENCRLEVSSGLLQLNADLSVKTALIGTHELESGEYAVDDLPADVRSLVSGTGKLYVDYTPGQVVYKRSYWTGDVDDDVTKPGNWSDNKAPNFKDGGATLVFSNLTETTVSVPSKAKVNGLEFLGGANCLLAVADGVTLQLGHAGILSTNTTDSAVVVTNTISGLVQTFSSEVDNWTAAYNTVLDLDCDISAGGSAEIVLGGVGRFLLKGDNTAAVRPFRLQMGYYDIFSSTGLGSPTRSVTLENKARFFFHCLTNDVGMSGKLTNADPLTGSSSWHCCDVEKGVVMNGTIANTVGDTFNAAGCDFRGGLTGGNGMLFACTYTGSGYGERVWSRVGGVVNFSVGGAVGLMFQSGNYELGATSRQWPVMNIRASDSYVKMIREESLVADKMLVFGHRPDTALGTLDMNGFNQTVAGVDHNFYSHTREYPRTTPYHGIITSATPAVLTLSGQPAMYFNADSGVRNFNPTNNTFYTGAVGLRVAANANVSHTLISAKSTTTGPLMVESGTLVLAWGAGWTATTNVVVSGGTLRVEEESAPYAFGSAQGRSKAVMTLTGGTLQIDGGQATVRALSLDGKTYLSPGVYGSVAAQGVTKLNGLSGAGTLRVLHSTPNPGIVLIVR